MVLSAQRAALEVAARNLESSADSAHAADNGVMAPMGRTTLRELFEGAVGETRAHLQLSEADVQVAITRLTAIETQTQALDLRLGSGWTDLPL